MEIVSTTIIVLGFLTYIFFSKYYEDKTQERETMMLIRELTTAIKAGSSSDYTTSLPNYDEKPEPLIKADELVEIDQVEPDVLLRAIKR